jgi:prepilin-type N-terminal cleavage/methylation domain-containing protein
MQPSSTPQGGFTVLEVLIAILLLSVGILGLTDSAALTTRMIASARRHAHAVALGRSTVERLRSGECPAEGAGEASRGPYMVRWTVSPVAGGLARRAMAVVEIPRVRPARADTVSAVIPC